MNFPENLKYSKDHEWVLIEGDVITVGLSDHAQGALGDIVYLELPEVGQSLAAKDVLGVVESIKAVSDIYSPAAGEVIETHLELIDEPGQINTDPYNNGWLVKIKTTDKAFSKDLMDAKVYKQYVENLK